MSDFLRLTSANSFHQFEVAHSDVFGGIADFFSAGGLANLTWSELTRVAIVTTDKVAFLLTLFLIDRLFNLSSAVVTKEPVRTGMVVQMLLDFGRRHPEEVGVTPALRKAGR